MESFKTEQGILVKSKEEQPDFIVKLKDGYFTIWNVSVKYKTWFGGIRYKSFQVSSSHSEEEAIQTWAKQHYGGRYDFVTKETHPEFFI